MKKYIFITYILALAACGGGSGKSGSGTGGDNFRVSDGDIKNATALAQAVDNYQAAEKRCQEAPDECAALAGNSGSSTPATIRARAASTRGDTADNQTIRAHEMAEKILNADMQYFNQHKNDAGFQDLLNAALRFYGLDEMSIDDYESMMRDPARTSERERIRGAYEHAHPSTSSLTEGWLLARPAHGLQERTHFSIKDGKLKIETYAMRGETYDDWNAPSGLTCDKDKCISQKNSLEIPLENFKDGIGYAQMPDGVKRVVLGGHDFNMHFAEFGFFDSPEDSDKHDLRVFAGGYDIKRVDMTSSRIWENVKPDQNITYNGRVYAMDKEFADGNGMPLTVLRMQGDASMQFNFNNSTLNGVLQSILTDQYGKNHHMDYNITGNNMTFDGHHYDMQDWDMRFYGDDPYSPAEEVSGVASGSFQDTNTQHDMELSFGGKRK